MYTEPDYNVVNSIDMLAKKISTVMWKLERRSGNNVSHVVKDNQRHQQQYHKGEIFIDVDMMMIDRIPIILTYPKGYIAVNTRGLDIFNLNVQTL